MQNLGGNTCFYKTHIELDLTLLKYLMSSSEASVAESVLIVLMTAVSWSDSVFGD